MLAWDANDLIWLAGTWQRNDVGSTPGFDGDLEKALKSIRARVLYMPCQTDLYFHIEALCSEAAVIPNAELKIIPSLWGHLAGGGFSVEDATFINQAIKQHLAAKS